MQSGVARLYFFVKSCVKTLDNKNIYIFLIKHKEKT